MNIGMAHTVGTLMGEVPALIEADDTLATAKGVFRATHARHWPVVDRQSLVGMLSLRDLLSDRGPESLKACTLMNRSTLVVHPRDELVTAARLMNRHRLWCLPVVRDDQLIGIVTLNHFVEHAVMLLRQEEYELGFVPTVARLMTHAPLGTIQLLERVDIAQATMKQYHVRHLLVMRGDRLIGMLSDRDVLEVLSGSGLPASAMLVGEIMTSSLETTTPEADAADAGTLLVEKNIGALPVLRDGRVLGILCKSDFLHYIMAVDDTRG